MSLHLVLGLGVTGRAVVEALIAHGHDVLVVDDRPTADSRLWLRERDVELVAAPSEADLGTTVRRCDAVVPSPGVPDHHPVFRLALEHGTSVISELDLAGLWDRRPQVAITGTNGKTTVTELTRSILEASGRRAVTAGNTEIPLVAAITDPSVEVFVVEASSFRLLHSRHYAPDVGTWLNVAPDHLDNHATYGGYVEAKAKIWADQAPDQVAVGNADDPVVMDRLRRAPGRAVTFGAADGADFGLRGADLVLPDGEVLTTADDLPRSLPHDLTNALAATATALPAGATVAGARAALLEFRGLPHRVALVGEARGVRWYDDSKATAPHATAAAVRGFESVVLIAGGRNKGLDLRALADEVDRIRGVVAIGEAADEVEAAFAGLRPVRRAASMDEAVEEAAGLAQPGDVVLLSPGCASFDWYGSYSERGDDFVRAVETHHGPALGSRR